MAMRLRIAGAAVKALPSFVATVALCLWLFGAALEAVGRLVLTRGVAA